MNRVWLAVWLALLAAQALTMRVGGPLPPAGPAGVATEPIPAGLLELARETNAQWEPPAGPGLPGPAAGEASSALLRREQALLRLREIEDGLHARGVEARLTRELRGWIGARPRGGAQDGADTGLSGYLAGLAEWLEPFLAETDGPRLERAGLLPGNGAFPLLHFEMGGDPVQLGQRLLRLWEHGRPWQLEELELVRLPAAAWWMQGSWSYAPEAAP